MNNHLKNFYPAEENSKGELFSSPISQGGQQNESPAEIEKQIHLMQKKLHSYERRKQKIILEQAKTLDAADTTEPASESNNPNATTSSITSNDISTLSNNTSNAINTTGSSVNAAVIAATVANSDLNGNNSHISNMQITPNTTLSSNNRNLSFNNNGKLEFLAQFQNELGSNSEEVKQLHGQESNGQLAATGAAVTNQLTTSSHSVYKNQNSHPSSSNLNFGYGIDGVTYVTNEELMNSNANINKTLKTMVS